MLFKYSFRVREFLDNFEIVWNESVLMLRWSAEISDLGVKWRMYASIEGRVSHVAEIFCVTQYKKIVSHTR